MAADDLAWLSLRELASLIRDRRLSPVEVVRAMLDRIERLDSYLRVFITLTAEQALDEARQAEAEIARGAYRGPLHGIPVAHKDVYCTRGVRTTSHSALYLNFVPDEDAAVVSAWKQAGAISLGKANTFELANGREQHIFGIPRNPWDPSRVTGGSSSGSGGGLAAGLFYGASGTDGGGSIRAPAALCGLVGLRPTFGLVSRRGAVGTGNSTTTCCGPLARTVDDVALLLQPLAEYDPRDPHAIQSPVPIPDYTASAGADLRGVRVGVPSQHFLEPGYADPDVLSCLQQAISDLAELGAEVLDVDLPHVHLGDTIFDIITYAENAPLYRERLATEPEKFGFTTRMTLGLGTHLTTGEYLQAQQIRSLINRDFRRAFERVDVIVAPTSYRTARGPAEDAEQLRPHPRRPLSLPGGPSISVPCGFCEQGMPVGLQIAGRPWDDATVLHVARTYEQAHPFTRHADLTGPTDAAPLVMPQPKQSVEEATRARLDTARRELAETVDGLDLRDIGAAVRFQP